MTWISVKDRLPFLDQIYSTHSEICSSLPVLILDDLGQMWVAMWMKWHSGKEFWDIQLDNDNCCTCVCPVFNGEKDINRKARNVTHWMPLPKPPESIC